MLLLVAICCSMAIMLSRCKAACQSDRSRKLPRSLSIGHSVNPEHFCLKVSNGETINVDLRQHLELQRPSETSADDEYYRCMASGVTVDISPDSQFAFLALPHR